MGLSSEGGQHGRDCRGVGRLRRVVRVDPVAAALRARGGQVWAEEQATTSTATLALDVPDVNLYESQHTTSAARRFARRGASS